MALGSKKIAYESLRVAQVLSLLKLYGVCPSYGALAMVPTYSNAIYRLFAALRRLCKLNMEQCSLQMDASWSRCQWLERQRLRAHEEQCALMVLPCWNGVSVYSDPADYCPGEVPKKMSSFRVRTTRKGLQTKLPFGTPSNLFHHHVPSCRLAQNAPGLAGTRFNAQDLIQISHCSSTSARSRSFAVLLLRGPRPSSSVPTPSPPLPPTRRLG